MAVDYVVDQFRKMGMMPGGDYGGYIQKMILRKSEINHPSAISVSKDVAGLQDFLIFHQDFLPIPHPLLENTNAEAPLVFVGFGLDIPGRYSDYKGIDVKNKIVVVVSRVPEGLLSTFAAHFSSADNKMKTSTAKGTKGIVVINTASSTFSNLNPVIQSNLALNPSKTTV